MKNNVEVNVYTKDFDKHFSTRYTPVCSHHKKKMKKIIVNDHERFFCQYCKEEKDKD